MYCVYTIHANDRNKILWKIFTKVETKSPQGCWGKVINVTVAPSR